MKEASSSVRERERERAEMVVVGLYQKSYRCPANNKRIKGVLSIALSGVLLFPPSKITI